MEPSNPFTITELESIRIDQSGLDPLASMGSRVETGAAAGAVASADAAVPEAAGTAVVALESGLGLPGVLFLSAQPSMISDAPIDNTNEKGRTMRQTILEPATLSAVCAS